MEIRVYQKSGLGNQLFQYAAGLFFARRFGGALTILRAAHATAHSHGYPRPFLLSEFAITAPVRERTAADRVLCSPRPAMRTVAAALRALSGTVDYREPAGTQWLFTPDLPVTARTRLLYLEGYWQVHQYAAGVEAELRSEFSFRTQAAGQDRAVLDRIGQGPGTPVSLHLRRGDYTLAAEGMPALGMAYYRNAVRAMRERVADPVFYVFSDDIAYARGHLPQSERMVFVDHNRDAAAHNDLRLMAACRHHIIANSSFSWWGAWLNQRTDKVVLAPSRWVDPRVPHTDLLPPDWVEIAADTPDGSS